MMGYFSGYQLLPQGSQMLRLSDRESLLFIGGPLSLAGLSLTIVGWAMDVLRHIEHT